MTSKVHLSRSRDIPFNKLALSQSNVRRLKAGVSIEDLAEDIARRTLLQSLNVRPIRREDGTETGMYEVPAGGRRYRALELLVKQKRMAKTELVPCVVRDEGLAEEDSLAENAHREALHPLDQFRAFKTLIDKGLSEEDVAARFFVTANVVKQRLKLASVSEKLLQAYADDAMTLDQLMAFTVASDHKRQEEVWDAVSRSNFSPPYQIRRQLTEGSVHASDKRALFVGTEAYEAAGGAVLRDLFNHDEDGWLEDVRLLDRLTREKLEAEAQIIRAEGWKWIEAAIDFPYGHNTGMARISGAAVEMTEEEQSAYEALRAEYEKLEAEYADADELPEGADERLAQIETTLESLNERPVHYDPADIARAGAFMSVDRDGRLRVERGFVRPEDAPDPSPAAASMDARVRSAPDRATRPEEGIIVHGDEPTKGDDTAEKDVRLSDRLVAELTAHRTLALRDALARSGEVAFLAVLHALAMSSFYHRAPASCLEITAQTARFSIQGPDLADSASAKAIEARHASWQTRLPESSERLWETLDGLSKEDGLALFAHCAGLTVNAVAEPWVRRSDRIGHADALANAVDLDMIAAGWKPTAENYFSRVPKTLILGAVREAKGDATAQLIEHLKKQDMATEAERLLADTGWLPEPLRTLDPSIDEPDAESASAEDTALPAFLDDGFTVEASATA